MQRGQEHMMHNEGTNQLTETDPEMIKMIDLLDQDIKSYYSYISYVQEAREKIDMFSKTGKIQKRNLKLTSRYNNYNV